MHDPIFLVGFMGSGKSTIGRHLAEALGWRFIDTDVFVETRFRQRITDMFAEHGEAVFRRRERMAIEELMSMPDTVFATGGGLPCYTDTMDHLLEAGHVIYLRCSTPILTARLELCKRTRPTIRDKSGEELFASCKTPSRCASRSIAVPTVSARLTTWTHRRRSSSLPLSWRRNSHAKPA